MTKNLKQNEADNHNKQLQNNIPLKEHNADNEDYTDNKKYHASKKLDDIEESQALDVDTEMDYEVDYEM